MPGDFAGRGDRKRPSARFSLYVAHSVSLLELCQQRNREPLSARFSLHVAHSVCLLRTLPTEETEDGPWPDSACMQYAGFGVQRASML